MKSLVLNDTVRHIVIALLTSYKKLDTIRLFFVQIVGLGTHNVTRSSAANLLPLQPQTAVDKSQSLNSATKLF